MFTKIKCRCRSEITINGKLIKSSLLIPPINNLAKRILWIIITSVISRIFHIQGPAKTDIPRSYNNSRIYRSFACLMGRLEYIGSIPTVAVTRITFESSIRNSLHKSLSTINSKRMFFSYVIVHKHIEVMS